jgi:hypothetical protein
MCKKYLTHGYIRNAQYFRGEEDSPLRSFTFQTIIYVLGLESIVVNSEDIALVLSMIVLFFFGGL